MKQKNLISILNKVITILDAEVDTYVTERINVLENIESFETVVVEESEDGILNRATYIPKALTLYTFPSSIRVLKSSTQTVYNKNFKNYCYVVCASELAVGTDGTATVHTEALKAFSLCVRNLGWYRCLYPYNATAGYDVTDNTNTQVYDWNKEGLIDTTYTRHKSAVNAIWNVMMFDGAKKLFHPSYRAGSYNANTNSSSSMLYQNGANYLATERGYNYAQILHYYYDAAIGEQISYGPIIICSSHVRAINYSAVLQGHGYACRTCGQVELTAHTWVNYNSYYKCSVCGYESTIIIAP